jgi:hypothetical protein
MNNRNDIDYLKKWARNYFGFELPVPILQEIYDKRPKNMYANHSRYIKENILISRKETEKFIKRIQKLQA